MNRLFATAAGLVLIVTASACESAVETSVNVTDANSATVSVSLVMRGPASDAIDESPELGTQVESIFSQRGAPAKLSSSRGEKRWTTDVDLDELKVVAPLTGVLDVAVERYTATVTLVEPSELRAAIMGFGDQAAIPVILDNTFIALSVTFPGDVIEASGDFPGRAADLAPIEIQRDGQSVTMAQPLVSFSPGTIVATGSPDSFSWTNVAVALGAVVFTGFVVITARRR